MKGERHHKFWSPQEDKQLEAMWAVYSVQTIARKLNRTPNGVEQRGRKALGLTGGRHGLLTLPELERLSGYGRVTIKVALEQLSIPLLCIPRTDARRKKHSFRVKGIDPHFYDKLIKYLQGRELGRITPRPGLRKGPAGMWGVAERGACCTCCKTADRPHYAKGLCERCYMSRLDKGWGRKGRPAKCVVCGRTERPYSCKGRCDSCDSLVRYREKRARKKETINAGRQAKCHERRDDADHRWGSAAAEEGVPDVRGGAPVARVA